MTEVILNICLKFMGIKSFPWELQMGSQPDYMILIILTGIELMKKQERTMTGAGASHSFLLWPGICMLFRSIIRNGEERDE
jgi:hypothetical protein